MDWGWGSPNPPTPFRGRGEGAFFHHTANFWRQDMRKQNKNDKNVKSVIEEAGKTCFPVDDACTLAGITLEAFAQSDELQNIYRTAQLQTLLTIRSKLVDEACKGDTKSIRLFLDSFQTQVLPRLEDMPDE